MIPIINEAELASKLNERQNPYFKEYYAFYSSWFGGIITNPRYMLLPIDDHMVHRGDGVFEAMKAVNRSVYLMNEHMERLSNSAEAISLKTTTSMTDIKNIVLETLKAADKPDAMIRLYLSRGPGNFSVNPYDSVGAQLYVVVGKLTAPGDHQYQKGIHVGISSIPVKPDWLATIKSCNYLPNVLMKKEAVDRKLDYVVGLNSNNHISESATENIFIVDCNGTLVHPPLNGILKGTTMIRACELATENGIASEARSISVEDIYSAKEVMIAGTSLNILPVVKFEDQMIANGKPGLIAQQLNQLMLKDIQLGSRSIAY